LWTKGVLIFPSLDTRGQLQAKLGWDKSLTGSTVHELIQVSEAEAQWQLGTAKQRLAKEGGCLAQRSMIQTTAVKGEGQSDMATGD
jgi:hypothetical protein